MKRTIIIAAVAFLSFATAAAARADDQQPGLPDQPDQPSQQQPAEGLGPIPGIRDQIQSQYQDRIENMRNNRDYRNMMLDDGGHDASGTPPLPDQRPLRPEDGFASGTMMMQGREDGSSSTRRFPPFMTPFIRRFASTTDFASTTLMRRAEQERGSSREMRADMFALTQNNLVEQLTRALDNLVQIRGRIADRIQTESQNGHDMTAAISLLAIADGKLASAKAAIQTIADYQPVATSTAGVTATTTVGVDQARSLGDAAIQAVKDARGSLVDVVTSIAHALGQDGQEASSTSSTTNQ
ncbi:MAG: hypothetical protein KGI69_00160 [Patescibacteria group bacterium]|nr:hypothetical protein [Patescibacteria group bacterium]